ncbi:MAG: 4-aminobutyrate--2-oxoglutarate transaminase [Deltaproteobacteria bacterium]|nr:4-aminobutyrate--2-oxoglutarate transaminase [Deltaproteobacteria bacterium]
MSPSNQSIEARAQQVIPRGVSLTFPVYVERALNAELWDVEGRRYLDFASGIAVLNTGHRHPQVMAAAREQLERFTHTAFQVVPYESAIRLGERVAALVPGAFAKKVAFFSTGAEAIENAVKIARVATGRSAVIAFSGAFHGRTLMAAALTGKVSPYKRGFGPMPGEVYHAPFPTPLHGVSVEAALDGIERIFHSDVEPERVAAIVIEPVQGEGGFYPAPPELLRALRALCDTHRIVLVADEVQTGFGRTGRMFAMEHSGVAADLVTVAKSLSGGFPLSAVIGKAEIMDAPHPGGLGGTFAGNPVAIAAAHAVLDVLAAEKLSERSAALGQRLAAFLTAQQARVPQLAEVRGLGSMVAAEFLVPGTRAPDAAFAKRVQQRAREQGLLLLTCGVHANVIRFLYPLTIPEPHFEEGLAILGRALQP